MQNTYSATVVSKPKKLRRRKKKVALKPKAELTLEEKTVELYEQLQANGPRGVALPEKFKDKKYYELLKRIGRGMVSDDVLRKLINAPEDSLIAGPIGRELDADSKLRTIFNLSNVSMNDCYHDAISFIALRLPTGKIGLTNTDGDIYMYDANTKIYAVKLGVTRLPVDLREWNNKWLSCFFKLRLRHAETHSSCNGGRVSYKADKLHTIRRINSSPSKKQRREISKDISKPVFEAAEVDLNVDDFIEADY